MMEDLPRNGELPLTDALFTVFLCVLFGANPVAIKVTFLGIGVFTSVALRFVIASAAILAWAFAAKKSFRISEGQIRHLVVLAFSFVLQLSLFYIGISKTKATHATLLSNLLPFYVLFLAHLFIPGDRVTIRKLVGILMGFAGIVFVLMEKDPFTAAFHAGDFIILLAVFVWACRIVYLKRIIHTFESFHLVFYPILFSVPFFFMGGFLWDDAMFYRLDMRVFGSLLYQGLVTASFGFLAWNRMLQKYGATALHSFVFIMPVSGVILSAAILGEPLTFHLLAAMGSIVTGILVVHSKIPLPLFRLGRNV